MKFFRKNTSKPTQTELAKTDSRFEQAKADVRRGFPAIDVADYQKLTKGQQVILVGLQTDREQAGLWR